jgi:formiminoglutamase
MNLPLSTPWQGRIDSEDGSRGLRWHQVVNQHTTDLPRCTLLGFACDLGVQANKGRVGAKAGPEAIRAALANMAWHAPVALHDDGDIVASDDLESAQHQFSQKVLACLQSNDFVVAMGGGHEIAWASYQGFYHYLEKQGTPDKKIGIINFDAHFDLRKPAPHTSSGTPFWQIAQFNQQRQQPFHYTCLGVSQAANTPALFDMAQTTGTRYLCDMDCNVVAAKQVLAPMFTEIDELYVTICLDAFPASMAPGVSAPSALGIAPQFVINMLHYFAEAQSMFGFTWRLADVAEMNPCYDVHSQTAKLAARLVFELLQAKFNNKP